MNSPTVSIIIISYNTKQLILNCLNSIEKYEANTPYEIIIIDNGSTDGSTEAIKQHFPQVELIQNIHNEGFSKANNQGIQHSKGDYILLLNSDTEFTQADTLKRIIDIHSQHTDVGAIVPKLLNSDRTPQPSAYHFPTILTASQQYLLKQPDTYSKYLPNQEQISVVDVAVMAAFLIPKEVIESIGTLDEQYFMYFEDFDYCRRISSAHLKIYYTPQVEILHHHGASGKRSEEQLQRLTTSSKQYHGLLNYYLITAILWLGQKLNYKS